MTHIKKLVMHGFKSFARPTEIVFDKGLNCIAGPNGSGKSARWDTEVLLASGDKKPIGEIVEESLKKSSVTKKIDDGIITKENPLGISILSINPETMKIEISKIRAFMKRDGEPNLYTIKTNNGKEVTTTSCHPVMIYRHGKIVSEIVQNLREGDLLATPNKIDLLENNKKIMFEGLNGEKANSEEFARFLGYIVGDGCIIKNSRVDFVNADKEILNNYRQIVNFLGFKSSLCQRRNSIAQNIYIYSRSFANNLINLFKYNYKKEKKHIPKEILFGEKKILKNFLAALFDCDSSLRKDNPTFEYVTMSEELANNVILGLLRFGIVARKGKKLKRATNTIEKRKREYFYITVEGKEKIYILYKNIPLLCPHKKELLRKWAENNIIPNTNKDILPLEVNKEIKEVFNLLGIKPKPLRKKYPFLMAYIENRCNASRRGLAKLIPLIQEKFSILCSHYNNLCLNQAYLIKTMIDLNISGQEGSKQIGLNKAVIMRDWNTNKFHARPENLQKLYGLLKMILKERIARINHFLVHLNNLANSDIFWDKISKIEKVAGEKYVYDLEVENNHNFIANNIFVHNSNIPDAICFVLGRLSIKSMRASRASKLIFHGGKEGKPAQFAKVSMIFDNNNNEFSLPSKEVEISRIVKRDGNSIYKINNEIKTRQEVLELLGQTGIDPNGFNIILQGQIDSIIKMHPEEKRQIIEEISGILVYEQRKEKSLKELEKTESELKEVKTILNERRAYLSNLEKEREQALKYEQLQKDIKKCKASIINKKTESVKKEIDKTNKALGEKERQTEKFKQISEEIKRKIQQNNEKVSKIEEEIEKKTGIEQEHLRNKIFELKTESARLSMNKEHVKDQLSNSELKENSSKQEMERLKSEIKDLENKSGIKISNNEKTRYEQINMEIEEVKQKISELELKKEKNALHKNELSKKNAILDERIKKLNELISRINELSRELENRPKNKSENKEDIRNKKDEHQKALESSQIKIREIEREIIGLVTKREIERKDVEEILRLSQCPKCKQIVNKEHKENLIRQIKDILKNLEKAIDEKSKNKKQIEAEIEKLSLGIRNFMEKQQELEKFFYMEQEQNRKMEELEKLKNYSVEIESGVNSLKNEIASLKKEDCSYEDLLKRGAGYNEKLEKLREELIKIKLKKPFEIIERDINIEIELKKREIEQAERNMKQARRDSLELIIKLRDFTKESEIKSNELKKREIEQESIEKKFKKFLEEKSWLQKEIHDYEIEINEGQMNKTLIDNEVNNLKIEKARIEASLSSLEIEFKEFQGLELFDKNLNELETKLQRCEEQFKEIGPVNLRSLEVYETIKKEYDEINAKVEKLEQEKTEILKIVQEIDKKKKKSFLQTLSSINESFTKNYSMLTKKGVAFLDLENKEDPFADGLNIIIKLGKGKYMESELLSGGEKVIVALALIFAIQKYRPYSFYIFDEIDAALDKCNSEILTNLIRENIKNSQYLMVSHNDVVISNADILYGTSMQEGITKVFSLRV